ncbi:ADP-ribosylglycohydrolase family protein [Thermodesulfobacteriota bacterium]
MENQMLDRIKGSYFAAAIGDAMGGPVETMHYSKIQKTLGKVEEFMEYKSPPCHMHIDYDAFPTALRPHPGSYTDDTRGRNLMASAVIEKGGRITADDFSAVLVRDINPEQWWPAVMVAYYKIKNYGMAPRDAGLGNPPGGGVAWYSPIGIINAGDSRQAAWDTFDVCSFLKRDSDRDLASAVPAAVAEALMPDSTIDSVVEMAMKYINNDSAAYIERAVELARKSSTIEQFYEGFYSNLLVEWDAAFQLKVKGLHPEAMTSCDLREQVAAAIGMFYFCKGDPKETIIATVNYGRDSDTISTTAGSIAGAFKGAKALPQEWVKTSLEANPDPDMNEICEKLYEILIKELNAKERRVKLFQDIDVI